MEQSDNFWFAEAKQMLYKNTGWTEYKCLN